MVVIKSDCCLTPNLFLANPQFYAVMKKFFTGTLCGFCALLCPSLTAQNVWTQHNDQARTGWYPSETVLTTNNVNTNTFGFNFSHQTDDKIVGQPLVVLNVNIPNKGLKDVVFVTTLNNSVYAFDADANANAYWQTNFSQIVAPAPAAVCSTCRPALSSEIHPDLCGGGYGDFNGNMGIISTPVIDTLSGTMFFVTKLSNPNEAGYDNHNWNDPSYPTTFKEYAYTSSGFHQYLHAIDITTGLDRPNSPVEITASAPGTGDGQTSAGIITFNPRTQFNRAGLVLSNGIIYITFAAHCDNNPSHGWVLSYNAGSLTQVHAYCATPNDGRGGIWMSGTAPAVDENGNLYVTTGNALIENPGSENINRINNYPTSVPSVLANRGEGVIELTPDLTISSYFTPYNYIALNDADDDFPTQVMLLPGTGLALTGCKDGNLYVMKKTGLGGYNTSSPNGNLQTVSLGGSATMHSSFGYFGGANPYLYQFSENTQLSAFPVTSSGLGTKITNSTILGPSGYMGGFLSVSSNGTDPSTGILWAYQAENGCNANNTLCGGMLHAVKAGDITTELWNSDMETADKIKYFNKFTCPTIALGKVYIAGNTNQLLCYGLKTNTTCINNIALGDPVTVSSTGSGSAANTVDNNFTTSWASVTPPAGQNATGYIYIDLGNGSANSFDICRIGITWAGNNYARAYNLEVSDDAVTWTTVQSVTNNTADYNEFNSVETGRYVRIDFVTNNYGNSYIIDEIQVFGAPASPCRAPSNLAAASLSATSEQITWDAVAGASYIVKYKSDISQEYLVRNVTTNTINLSALTCGYLYDYSVQSVCGGVPGGISQGSFAPTGCPVTSCDLFPVRYFHLDIGDIGMAGTTCKNGDIYTLQGSGTDIGGISDQFQFAYTYNNNGDYEAYGHLIEQDQVYPNNKLGIMIRDSLTSTSRFAFMASVDNGSNFIFEYRDVAGGPVTTTVLPALYQTPWMKVVKTGTNYTGYSSADNITWTQASPSVNLNFGNDPGSNPDYGMAVTSANNTALSSGQIEQFTFDAADVTPLPVRLLNFTAKDVNNDHVLISWATSMEHLSDYFLVLRSTDNSTFQTIGKVGAVGESEITQYYSLNDNNPAAGINYYRLKEFDKDGKFYLSPVVSVNFDLPAGFEIYPNPAGDFTSVTSQRDPIDEVNLYDVTGKQIQDIRLNAGQMTVKLNVSGLSKGVYFVTVKTGSVIYRQKLIKQ
jgi:hypothetical protein